LRELDEWNAQDSEIKAKVCKHCESPKNVSITRTALDDLGLIPLSKDAVVEAVKEHINLKRRMYTDVMDNKDIAYIFKDCDVDGTLLYVKVRFFKKGEIESMLIFSAHLDRRW
jgi:hypothetical protein